MTLALSLARDLLAVAGVASISYGAWLMYEPAGFVVAGLIVLAASLFGALRSRAS